MDGLGETSHQVSIAGASDEQIAAVASAIISDLWNPKVQWIDVAVSDPVEDFMATLAWRESRPVINLSNALCKYKVRLHGIGRIPKDPGFKVSLIVGSYMDVRPRTTEIVDCLEKNIDNDAISDIHLFVEDPIRQWENWIKIGDCADVIWKYKHHPALEKLDRLRKHPKVTLVPFGRRPFFSEYFAYANQALPAGRTVIVSNSDIEFDQSVRMLGNYPLDGIFGCLSRDGGGLVKSPGGYAPSDCQDAWIFTTPTLDLSACRWTLGLNGGEHVLAYEAEQAGYVLLNPCMSVIGAHRHASNVRRWTAFPPMDAKGRGPHAVSIEALGSKMLQEEKNRRGLR